MEGHLRFFILAAASIGAIITTIFSLSHGIFEIFPFLYILPILLTVYFYPKHAVIFALLLSIIYISLIYFFNFQDPVQVAISTAWFAIFITIAVVASSYANDILEEQYRIRQIINNSQDGIICIVYPSLRIRDINPKCSRELNYDRKELRGNNLSQIWPASPERDAFFAEILSKKTTTTTEALLTGCGGNILRFLISSLIVTKDSVICSAVNITESRMADEEIRQTLEDLEKQVRERTSHLEKINEKLLEEIDEHRRFQTTISPQEQQNNREDKQ